MDGKPEALRDPEPSVRHVAAKALGQMGKAAATPEVLEALRACLWDEDEWVRYEAAWALERMGEAAARPGVRFLERGATLVEVLVALAVLSVVLGAVATGLAVWHGHMRRTVGAWRCQEVLETVRVQTRTVQVVCGRDVREVTRSACRAEVAPAPACRSVDVHLRLGGTGLRRSYDAAVPAETFR